MKNKQSITKYRLLTMSQKLSAIPKPTTEKKDRDWLGRKTRQGRDWLGRPKKHGPDWLGRG